MIESQQPIPPIMIDRAVCGGRPVVAHTRIPVAIVVGSLAGGMTFEQVMSEYDLSRDQVRAALAYASERGSDNKEYPSPHASQT